jgi:hypothetical protein
VASKAQHQPIELVTLYAFWSYPEYPFFCGGTITKIDLAGKVETKEFGPGNFFKPVLIVPVSTGKALRERLEVLRRDHYDARRALDATFMRQLPAELAFHLLPEQKAKV